MPAAATIHAPLHRALLSCRSGCMRLPQPALSAWSAALAVLPLCQCMWRPAHLPGRHQHSLTCILGPLPPPPFTARQPLACPPTCSQTKSPTTAARAPAAPSAGSRGALLALPPCPGSCHALLAPAFVRPARQGAAQRGQAGFSCIAACAVRLKCEATWLPPQPLLPRKLGGGQSRGPVPAHVPGYWPPASACSVLCPRLAAGSSGPSPWW